VSITYSHHHLHVTDLNAHRRFWIDGLGCAAAGRLARIETARMSGALVLLDVKPNTGGTKGTTVNHIGFQVPDLRHAVQRVKAAGFPMVTREEITAVPPEAVQDDMAFNPFMETLVAMAMGPEGTKVELVENPSLGVPIALHHVHFFNPAQEEMRDWYVRMFGASPGSRGKFKTAELPGVSLTVSVSPQAVVGTRGRVVDHIGFEVTQLDEFARRLEGAGARLEPPDPRFQAAGIRSAFMTDPWGTSVELTEGLEQALT
jgi:catechol 2,3-dioxygenase-like lactoylglutathione lyase family enzyme/predicted enzyme related to lactoylglutathione lyase